jgi:hypothetical protein
VAKFFQLNPAATSSSYARRRRGVAGMWLDFAYTGRQQRKSRGSGVFVSFADVIEVNDRATYEAIIAQTIESGTPGDVMTTFVELPSGIRTLDIEGVLRGTVIRQKTRI